MTILSSMRGFNQLGSVRTPYVPYDVISLNAISANISVTGNGTNILTAFKIASNGNWDSQINSNTAYTAPCTIEFSKQALASDLSTAYAMISWNVDPNTDASYSSLDYAAFPYQTTFYNVYHNNNSQNVGGIWDPNKRLYISYDTSGNIKHWNGSTLLFSVNYGTGKTVYLDTSFWSVDPTYGGFSNIRITKLTWNGNQYVNA